MHPGRPFIVLLIAALLLRGLPFAHALPAPVGTGSAAVAQAATCEEHEGHEVATAESGQAQPDASPCRIACDLAGAPALFTPPMQWPAPGPSARIATRTYAPGSAARAPALRPPIA